MKAGFSRRRLLRGAGGLAMGLPFLELLRSSEARAADNPPKRLIVVSHRQGTVMSRWAPTGTETSFALGDILGSLTPWQDRLVVIAGLDNWLPGYNTSGNGHQNAESSMLTARPFQTQGAAVLTPAGPSVEDVIADRISADVPYRRLDFAVGGGTSGSGVLSAVEFWRGPGDPIALINDPLRQLYALFGAEGTSEEELSRLQARRGSVLDAVGDNFRAFRSRLDAADKARLDAHADKIRELESRISGGGAACARPDPALPAGYDYGFDDDVSASVQVDLLVAALACDLTRVATLSFPQGHDPTFPWLSVNGGPVVPTDRYDNWHAMVHDGRDEPGLVTGFTWYAEQFAYLVERLATVLDPDGSPLLDSTAVLWISEFGNGAGHNTLKIPVVLAGNLGDAATGRYLNFMNGGPDGDWSASDHTTGQLFVSLLRLFGGTDQTFGHVDDGLPDGPLPGL